MHDILIYFVYLYLWARGIQMCMPKGYVRRAMPKYAALKPWFQNDLSQVRDGQDLHIIFSSHTTQKQWQYYAVCMG